MTAKVHARRSEDAPLVPLVLVQPEPAQMVSDIDDYRDDERRSMWMIVYLAVAVIALAVIAAAFVLAVVVRP